jgi:hypothetical protein
MGMPLENVIHAEVNVIKLWVEINKIIQTLQTLPQIMIVMKGALTEILDA